MLLLLLLGIYADEELLDHMGILFFYILKSQYNVFLSGCTISCSHQECTSIPIFPHPHQDLSFFVFHFFFSGHPNGCGVLSPHFPND
jgi:hypothetical protein